MGHGEENGYDQRAQQLQEVRIQPQPQHDLYDDVVDHRADGNAGQLQCEVAEQFPEDHIADDDGSQADHDGPAAHVHVHEALIV